MASDNNDTRNRNQIVINNHTVVPCHRKTHLIYGYLRQIQDLLSNNNTFHNIKDICISYIYWCYNESNIYHRIEHFFLHPQIVKQQYILEQRQCTQFVDELKQIMLDRLKHLQNEGFLSPHLVAIINDPMTQVRQHRGKVMDELEKRLALDTRPTIPQLQQRHIIPYGAYIYDASLLVSINEDTDDETDTDSSSESHIRHQPFFMTETILSLENYFASQCRPSLRQLLMKGIVTQHDIVKYFAVDLYKLNDTIRKELKYSASLQNILIAHSNDITVYMKDAMCKALESTVRDALKQSCINTQSEEALVLEQMSVMSDGMKELRDSLDKYFLDDDLDVLLFEQEEETLRESFGKLQNKLLKISTRQNAIHNKLRILHSIEKDLPNIQRAFDDDLIKLYEYQQILNGDLNALWRIKNIGGICEVQRLKQNIGNKLCELRIKGFRKMIDAHCKIGSADTLNINAITYHAACFVLFLWFGTDIPSEIQHVLASFVAIKCV